MRHKATFLIVAGLMTLGLAINLVLLPNRHVISSLYIIPVLVACLLLSPRVVAGIAAVGVLCYVGNAFIEHRPPLVMSIAVVTLSLAGYVTVRYADQRQIIVERAREAEQARQQLQMFLGMVSHDLAGALGNLLAGAELVGRAAPPYDESARVGQMALDGAEGQMQRLLSDLRDTAAIGAGGFSIHPDPTDLAVLAREVVTEQQVHADRHTIAVSAPGSLRGEWDADRLRQLLTNLVSNAIKYSPAGGEVHVSLRSERNTVTIRVTDQGVGIPPDQGNALFQPFARLASGVNTSGSGLGLAISKAIVEAHGGVISVESSPGAGSVFTVRLPLGSRALHTAAVGDGGAATPSEPALIRTSTMTAG